MALKITCPHCRSPRRLGEPFPVPGTEVQCDACGRALAISYPPGMVERLRSKGLRFTDSSDDPSPTKEDPEPGSVPEPRPLPLQAPQTGKEFSPLLPPTPTGPTQGLAGPGAKDSKSEAADPSSQGPLLEESPTEEMPPRGPSRPGPGQPWSKPDEASAPRRAGPSSPNKAPEKGAGLKSDQPPQKKQKSGKKSGRKSGKEIALTTLKWVGLSVFFILTFGLGALAWWLSTSRRPVVMWIGRAGMAFGLTSIVAAGGGAWWAYGKYQEFTQDLPSVEQIADYYPPTVTVIYDSEGRVLGEIYNASAKEGGRRYIVPIGCPWGDADPPIEASEALCIPQVVQDAFIAAEDANFREHDGVDYEGIVRAALRNVVMGKKAHGASTITMQVARNMPALQLTKEKTYRRKVREIVLAQRMEEVFDKDYILFLYLNQIDLGSRAYGVEAASRVYFDKHVAELTLAEAAVLAGLPQRPSDYSPYKAAKRPVKAGEKQSEWDLAHEAWRNGASAGEWVAPQSARSRQEYVLGQMKDKGFISGSEYDQAMSERVAIVEKENELLTLAPYFAAEVQQYLETTYGEEKVYEDGLKVYTTCDLELQVIAQKAVSEHVLWADKRRGWRGAISHIEAEEIPSWRQDQDLNYREAIAKEQIWLAAPDKSPGWNPIPDDWTMQDPLFVDHPADKEVYRAVVLEVETAWARVAVGRYEMVIPIQWAWWAREPDPRRSWRSSSQQQNDMHDVLTVGDIIEIRLRDFEEEFRVEAHRWPDEDKKRPSPGFKDEELENLEALGLPLAELHQQTDLQGAMLSYRLDDGAIQAMVGGVDYSKSQYNRAIKANRQVGSTIKPLVYTAAINQGHYHAASRVLDQAISVPTSLGQYWRPGNYGEEYEGWLTMRQALQRSKNVCTVQILQKTGVESVFDLAGPGLRIGYDQPACLKTHISVDTPCSGVTSASALEGMKWCEVCDPSSCPLARVEDHLQCIDSPQTINGIEFCHSCDINIRLCSRPVIAHYFDPEPRYTDESLAACADAHLDSSLFFFNGSTPRDLEFELKDSARAVPSWYQAIYRGQDDRELLKLKDAVLLVYDIDSNGESWSAPIWKQSINNISARVGKSSIRWNGQITDDDTGATIQARPGTYRFKIVGFIDERPPEDDLAGQDFRRVTASGRMKEVIRCRLCNPSMGLGSSALTMVELAQGYSAFPTGGLRVTPRMITKVVDGDNQGTVIEEWAPSEEGWPRVLDEEVAGLGHWLVYQVAHGGTGHQAGKLARSNTRGTIGIAGKTGTTNNFNDAWFVGYTPELITAAWVGHDGNEKLGVTSTGGRTAMPIWMEYMKAAAPMIKESDLAEGEELPPDPRFEVWDSLQSNPERFKWLSINENKDSYNFGTVSSEITYTTSGRKTYPRSMPFKHKAGTDIWNMPGQAQQDTQLLEEMDW